MTTLPEEFRHLTVSQRIALAQALWDSVADQTLPSLSEAKRTELAKRAAEDDALPDEVLPWEQVKANILSRLSNGKP